MARVFLAIFLCACADLPSLESGTCGNGVVEDGEDCDGVVAVGTTCGAASSGAGACHFTCTPPAQRGCPLGWGCGTDAICRHAGGLETLQIPTGAPWALPARALAFGDLDGDRHPDAIGYGGTAFTVRFGSGDGRFNAAASFGTGFGTNVPAFRDLPLAANAPGLVDAVLPLPSGLFGLHVLADRTVSPLAYPASDAATPPVAERMLSLPLHSGDAGESLVHLVGTRALLFDQEDATDGDVLFELPDGLDVSQLIGEVAIGDLGSGALMVLAFSGVPTVYLVDGAGVALRVALPGPLGAGALLADVDGDGDLDLLVSLASGEVAVAFNAGGVLGTVSVDDRFDAMIDADCGTARWPLAAGDLDGDGVADYVGAHGVCLARGGTLIKTGDLPGDRPGAWSAAVITDMNRDGTGDVAAISDGAPGIDLLTGDPAGGGLFNYARIPTDAPPRLLTAGDFDGDFVPDVAFVSAFARPDVSGEEVAVVFGATDARPAPPTVMGVFPHVTQLERTTVTLSPAPRDLTDDLVVQTVEPPRTGDPEGDQRRSLTFLIGDPQRIMSATAPLRAAADVFDKPGAIALGDLDSDGFVDAAVLATRSDGGQALWALHGDALGRWHDSERTPLTNAIPLPCARLSAARLEPGGPVHILGFTADSCDGAAGSPAPLFVDIVLGPSGPTVSLRALSGTLTVPTSAVLADLDGDGNLDLLVAFAGEWAAPPDVGAVPGAGVAIYFDRGGRIDPTSPTLGDSFVLGGFPDRVSPFAAATAELDGDGARELAIVTSGGLFVAEPTVPGPGFAFSGSPLTLAAVGRPASRLIVTDLNGDGLDDLLFDGDDQLHVFLSLGVNAATALTSEPARTDSLPSP